MLLGTHYIQQLYEKTDVTIVSVFRVFSCSTIVCPITILINFIRFANNNEIDWHKLIE